MELTTETLRDVQFRQAWKGYDTEEVDDFLDVVSTGVAELHERLVALSERASKAESRVPVATSTGRSDSPESAESVRRTLVLAQRAADLVVTEAKSVADRIVADAHNEAAKIVGSAQGTTDQIEQAAHQRAAQILSESEAAAERITATKAAELQGSLAGLAEEQGRRRFELDQLRQQVDGYRAQLRSDLEAQMRRLETLPEPPHPLLSSDGASGDATSTGN
jgi:cell division initiation protein